MKLKGVFRRLLLNHYGYVKLPAISGEVLTSLLNYYNEKAVGFDSGIFNSVLISGKKERKEHDLTIRSILNDYLERQIEDFKIVIAIFFSKSINGFATVGTHQDPTFVDTDLYDDFTIWIPLVDTDIKDSGRMKFLNKSHKRYSKVNLSKPEFYYAYNKQEFQNLRVMNLKKGEPILFFNRTIHSSEDNKVYNQRPAISVKITTKNAPVISYHVVNWDERLVDMYYQDDSYYVQESWNESVKPVTGKFYKQIKLDSY